ncbi:MAG: DUF4157 domain-containing protein [Kofleriaceae bacterium]|nr:DUF4157 domain-containing protein [Kofleriaceae bacterium]
MWQGKVDPTRAVADATKVSPSAPLDAAHADRSEGAGSYEGTLEAGLDSSGAANVNQAMANVRTGRDNDPRRIAARGIEGTGARLPFFDRIQASFGRHDISGVRAHVGGAAGRAARQLGARAFAFGNHIAFDGTPDLHTAAHEAAHHVQQRAGIALKGGIDEGTDEYEQHADEVADAVVHGESAEALLDRMAGRGASLAPAAPSVVQRKAEHAPAPPTSSPKATSPDPALIHDRGQSWPLFARTGKPYIIEERDGLPGFWVVRDWITSAPDKQKQPGSSAILAPSRARELLTAMGWRSTNLEYAARTLSFKFSRALEYFAIGAVGAFSTGLPQGRDALVARAAHSALLVTLALDDATLPPDQRHEMTSSEKHRALRAAATFTGLAVVPEGNDYLLTRWVPAARRTGNGVIAIELERAVCQTLFGLAAYNAWAGVAKEKHQRAPAREAKAPKLKVENYYKRPIPGQLRHYGDLVEAGEALRLDVQVDWPRDAPNPEFYDAPPMMAGSKFGTVALLRCRWRFERIDGAAQGPVPKGSVETRDTTVGEAVHRFRLAPGEDRGVYRVTCDARFDAYFEPATFTREVVVLSSAGAMAKLQTEAFAGLGAATTDRRKGAWKGDARPGFKASPAAGTQGDIEDPLARDRAAQRDRLRAVADYLRPSAASGEAVEALDRELARQQHSEKLLAADRARGWQPFQVRGAYLSRTEGLASGPLDLHGTVHIELHYDRYAGDGPSTTLRVRNDKVVVRLRDLSRRFEQEDFEFEGRADTFEDALRSAFEDLAVAYPRGRVSLEAEEIRSLALRAGDGAPGPQAALGPGTGKVIGFQRSTETTWKKVKEKVWDPVASVVVNLGAIALMTFVPGSAVIVAPAVVAYNTVPSIERIRTEAERGTLTFGTFAMSTGEIALNVLPLVSRAKPLTRGWFLVETANWGGQVALMGASAVEAARQLQAVHVAALAQEYQQFLELQKHSLPSDPGLADAEKAIREKAAAVSDEIGRQFLEQVKLNGLQMVAGSVVHQASAAGHTALLEHLARAGHKAPTGDGASVQQEAGAPQARANETVGQGAPSGDLATATHGHEPGVPHDRGEAPGAPAVAERASGEAREGAKPRARAHEHTAPALSPASPGSREQVLGELERDRPRREQLRQALGGGRGHPGIEVHSHFMGIVDASVFRQRAAAAAGDASSTSWIPLLDKIVELPKIEAQHNAKQGKVNEPSQFEHKRDHRKAISHRAKAGDAIDIAREAQDQVQALVERAADARISAEDRAAYVRAAEIVAEEASRTALSATPETPFDGAYVIVDGLVQTTFGGLPRPGEPKEAATQRAFDDYIREAILRLAETGTAYSEQSTGYKKLSTHVHPDRIRAIMGQLVDEGRIYPGQVEIKLLGMLKTGHYGERDTWLPPVEGATPAPRDPHEAETRKRERDQAHGKDAKAALEQTEHPDVIGRDIGAPELMTFDEAGMERYKTEYRAMLERARATGQVLVNRPHVGEGAMDTETGQPYHTDKNRAIHGDEPSHYQRARQPGQNARRGRGLEARERVGSHARDHALRSRGSRHGHPGQAHARSRHHRGGEHGIECGDRFDQPNRRRTRRTGAGAPLRRPRAADADLLRRVDLAQHGWARRDEHDARHRVRTCLRHHRDGAVGATRGAGLRGGCGAGWTAARHRGPRTAARARAVHLGDERHGTRALPERLREALRGRGALLPESSQAGDALAARTVRRATSHIDRRRERAARSAWPRDLRGAEVGRRRGDRRLPRGGVQDHRCRRKGSDGDGRCHVG